MYLMPVSCAGSNLYTPRYSTKNGLVMLEGSKRIAEAKPLYARAAACEAADAMERLDIALAKAELAT
jgi:hypothetical protein